MIMALSFGLLLQVAPIPPALPRDPGPERRAAARDPFPREPYVSEYSWAISIAASQLSGEVLSGRGLNLYDRDDRLSDRLVARAKAEPHGIVEAAIRCVAEPMAQRLYVPDLTALKVYAASPEGRNFWSYYFASLPWLDCFTRPVRAFLAPFLDADLKAVVADTPLR